MKGLLETTDRRYVRDPHSKALLAVDRRAAEDYKLKSKMINKNKELEEEIATVRDELEQIKELLQILIKRDSNE